MGMFKVWCESQGGTEDGAREIDAHNEEHAAEEWARHEDSDSADYIIIGGSPATVKVREVFPPTVHELPTYAQRQVETAPGPVVTFIVHGETRASYSAEVVPNG